MYRVHTIPAFAALVLLSGCGDSELPLAGAPPLELGGTAMEDQIEFVRTAILSDVCFREQQDVSQCNWQDYPFDANQFGMEHSTGEAILIVDEFPTLPPRTIRYKNRLKGLFRADTQGSIHAVPAGWRAPVTLFDALSTFASPRFIPAEALRRLSEPIDMVYGFYDYENVGHGGNVFSLLVEANPHNPIVLLDLLTLPRFAPAEFCDGSGTDESHARLRWKAEAVAHSLRGLMAAHNVRYVNVSGGETLATIRQQWLSSCGGALPSDAVLRAKLQAFSPVAEALFNTPGVFAAHAAINASNPDDFPFDFPSDAYSNRLRAGYFTSLGSGLDSAGRGNHSALQGWPGPQNADIYLNSGVLPQRPFPYNTTPLLQVNGFGVDIFPITWTTTSWIAPLALSRFIHVRHQDFAGSTMDDALIPLILRRMTPSGCNGLPGGRCVYQDPLLHGQTEAVRLLYRPREYVEP